MEKQYRERFTNHAEPMSLLACTPIYTQYFSVSTHCEDCGLVPPEVVHAVPDIPSEPAIPCEISNRKRSIDEDVLCEQPDLKRSRSSEDGYDVNTAGIELRSLST